MRWILLLCLVVTPAFAQDDRAGEFDYYVLALSWSPNWCAIAGDARGARQCGTSRDFGWILHGLWPQHERGWPSDCTTSARDPNRAQTAAMADIMGSADLARYQWRKHGRCTGLTAAEYFAIARRTYEGAARPEVLRRLKDTVALPAAVVEEAFLEVNPDWTADMLTITCKAGRIQEARLCLAKDLTPRICGADVVRDCTMDDALMAPIR